MPQPRQPFLHDLVCTLAAPTQVWSAYDGQIGAAGPDARASAVPGCAACRRTRAEHGRAARERRAARAHRHHRGGRRQPGSRTPTAARGLGRRASTRTRARPDRPGAAGAAGQDGGVARRRWRSGPRPVALELTLRLAYDLVPIEQIKTGATGQPAGAAAFEAIVLLRCGATDELGRRGRPADDAPCRSTSGSGRLEITGRTWSWSGSVRRGSPHRDPVGRRRSSRPPSGAAERRGRPDSSVSAPPGVASRR